MTPTQLPTHFFSVTRDSRVAFGTRNLDIILYLDFSYLLGHFHDSPGDNCVGLPSEEHFQKSW